MTTDKSKQKNLGGSVKKTTTPMPKATNLNDLTTKELKDRRENVKAKIEKATSKGNLKKVEDLQKRQFSMTDAIQANKAEKKLNDIFTSEAFLNLSPANQQVVRTGIDLFTPEKLKNFKLSTVELYTIQQEAQRRAESEYNYSKSQFDLDAEQSLRQDTAALQRALDVAISDPLQDDNKKIAIRNLQDALSESTKQYQIAADRKNLYLQTQLGDIQNKLDTTTSRASEDEIIQLRQLQRKYDTELRATQDNMAQRGLVFSGIRAQAEQNLAEDYSDTVTTAQLAAKRIREDAQTQAAQQKRDVNLETSQDIEDLVTYYTGAQKSAIQGAESQLGTGVVQGQLGAYTGVAGTDLTKDLYGGLTGSIEAQRQQQQQQDFADYESKYGTAKLQETFGTQLGTFTPTGGVVGSINTDNARQTKIAEEQKNVNELAIKQAEEAQLLASKGLPIA